jgi:hypothetical protein
MEISYAITIVNKPICGPPKYLGTSVDLCFVWGAFGLCRTGGRLEG